MRTFHFQTVDVFTDRRFGGNPLAVFPDARGLSDEEMQSLATEFNLSETTFVLPPSSLENTARVRIFNPKHEMPFAGHPMVGTAFVLASMRSDGAEQMTFEVPAGLVRICLTRDGDAVRSTTIDAPRPLTCTTELRSEEIAECLGLHPGDVIVSHHAPTFASVGNTFMIAEVREESLDQALPNIDAFRRISGEHPEFEGRMNLFFYAHAGEEIRARMFAPLVGVVEDPATGSAATPLAALLLSLTNKGRQKYTIRQGEKMGRPSTLYAEAFRADDGIRARVGGSCVPVLKGDVTL